MDERRLVEIEKTLRAECVCHSDDGGGTATSCYCFNAIVDDGLALVAEVRRLRQFFDGTVLTVREREIVELRDQGLTLAAVGKTLGVSRERARQLEAIARVKFRLAMAEVA